MKNFLKQKSKTKLPAHPKHHHRPYRLKHFSLFFLGLMIGIAGTFKGGYIENRPFDVNSVSPATVKIYHYVCGVLKYEGQTYGKDTCSGGTGTGFLISSDGYIATSGHVVILDPADIMVSELSRNPALLSRFIASSSLGSQQKDKPGQASEIIARLYDLPPSKLSLENKREVTFVALGDRPLLINEDNPKELLNYPESDYIKKAKLIVSDYSSKDLLNIEQVDKGFSAKDVALIKISIKNAPLFKLADSSKISQNAPLNLIGFPADADNQLTANDHIIPSITNGNISSIRTSSGVISRLFQTDADASQGNSGGPAVNDAGEAFGIVTYRFKDNNTANAAKSYIRDIDDLKALIKAKSIDLNTNSEAQNRWDKGLKLAGNDRYSKALPEYRAVSKIYPAHRLVGVYAKQAEQAILDGKDIKDPPYVLIITLLAIIGGCASVIVSAVLIARHRVLHGRYKDTYNKKRRKYKK